jgi:hypothetical protein
MSRWVCPECEREFGARNQAHSCAPGISVEDLLGRHPAWVAEIYRALVDPLLRLGPVHEDAVEVGVFLKADRKFAEVRPRARSVLLWVMLPEPHSGPAVRSVIEAGRTYAHRIVLTGAGQVDDDLRELLALAYDLATD